jgi:hypothetical protein
MILISLIHTSFPRLDLHQCTPDHRFFVYINSANKMADPNSEFSLLLANITTGRNPVQFRDGNRSARQGMKI